MYFVHSITIANLQAQKSRSMRRFIKLYLCSDLAMFAALSDAGWQVDLYLMHRSKSFFSRSVTSLFILSQSESPV
jgi:hypothetical protein